MQIGVYGSGYLATVISACLADFGTPVCCCHADGTRIMEVAKGNIPFFEKNLQEVIRRNVRSGRLVYSVDPEELARRAQVIFLAEDSAQGLEELVVRLAGAAGRFQVLSIVTPVRVGSTTKIEKMLKEKGLKSLLVCQPMFFTNGCAVEDFNWPDRIILGTPSSEAVSSLKQIFHPLVMRGVPVLVTNYETAELTREATTAFLATKISFINEIASLCEHVNADAVSLALAMGLDKKIAPRCLQPGAGMGGIFAETDMDSLTGLALAESGRCAQYRAEQRRRHSGVGFQAEHQLRRGIGFASTDAEFAGRGSARAGIRSGGDSRCAAATERDGEVLRIRLRGRRRRGCTGRGHRLARVPDAGFREDPPPGETANHHRHQESARLVALARHGIPVHGRGQRVG